MKHALEIIIYPKKEDFVKGEDGLLYGIIRHRIELPYVSAEDFDEAIHTGVVFKHPSDLMSSEYKEGVCIFKTIQTENKKEEEDIIRLGKDKYFGFSNR